MYLDPDSRCTAITAIRGRCHFRERRNPGAPAECRLACSVWSGSRIHDGRAGLLVVRPQRVIRRRPRNLRYRFVTTRAPMSLVAPGAERPWEVGLKRFLLRPRFLLSLFPLETAASVSASRFGGKVELWVKLHVACSAALNLDFARAARSSPSAGAMEVLLATLAGCGARALGGPLECLVLDVAERAAATHVRSAARSSARRRGALAPGALTRAVQVVATLGYRAGSGWLRGLTVGGW
jgi:hypothetical protein